MASEDFDDPSRAQKTLGLASVVVGILGLTATILPSVLAVVMGTTARDLHDRGHRGTAGNLGLWGVRLGYVGLGFSAVGVVVLAWRTLVT